MPVDRNVTNPIMSDAIAAFDWATTAIGPEDRWPESLRTVLSLALDTRFPMMIMWGPDLVQIYNDGYIGILGDKHPRSIGQSAMECWTDIWDSVGPMLLGVYHRGEPVYYENLPLNMTRGGRIEEAFFTFSYSPIRDGNGIGGLICVVNETTAHVLREREAGERAAALAELDRAKTQFFNNVSHEFRTPLTLMLGPLEELTRTLPNYEQRQTAELARRNAVRLRKLVNTLLDFSLAQSGLATAQREPVALEDLTRDIVSEFRSAYESAGLTLRYESIGSGPPVMLDRVMFEKVVLNLLSNALKFTFTGGVTVRTERRDATLRVRVRDSGIGIAEEHLEGLFERFRRVEGALSRTHEGTGIGLALVKELVDLNGGTVEVQSAVGSGTTFTVTLPLELNTDQSGAVIKPLDPSGPTRDFREEAEGFTRGGTATARSAGSGAPRVIIADDNADLREYLTRLLGARYNVDAVADGEALLERVRSSLPDLVVTDVMMPRMDGFSVVQALRMDPRTAHIPIVLLSARAGEESAVDGLGVGADDYVVKPFVAADLMARLEALLRRTRGAEAPTEGASLFERREAELLSAAADRFIAAIDSKAVADAVTSVLTPGYADWSAVAVPQADGRIENLSLAHREPAKAELGILLDREYPPRIGDGSALAMVLATREPLLLPHVSDEALRASARDDRHYAILSSLRLRSAVIVPVLLGERAIAALIAIREEGEPAFTERDRDLLARLASRAAMAFESARVYERERTIASTLQRALLPGTLPAVDGLRFSASYTPAAQESLVGGDWYDAFVTRDGCVIASIGDVVGHGIEAATVMATLRQSVRSFAVENGSPEAILAHLNRLLLTDHPGRLATALLARIDPRTLQTTIASAGHYGPVRIPAATMLPVIEPVDGLLLGVSPDAVFESRHMTLEPGDLIALFTDGYVENERNAEIGEVRLCTTLRDAFHEPQPAAHVHLNIFGTEQPRDDAALLTVGVDPTLPSLSLRIPAEPRSAAPARMALRRFLAGTALSHERRDELLVACGEALINAIEHAYPHGGGDILLSAQHEADGRIAMEIEDFGGWGKDDATPEQRGYGLPLMHAFADTVDIERTVAGTRVRLVAETRKKRARATPAAHAAAGT